MLLANFLGAEVNFVPEDEQPSQCKDVPREQREVV